MNFPAINISAQTGGDAIINPDYQGEVIDKFFLDLKGNASGVNTDIKATDYFITDDMNGIRIPIYGDLSHPAHPAAGQVIESEYTALIASINRAKSIRGTKDFYIFASKKLDGQNSFPDWTKDATTGPINVVNYTRLLTDFILFMKGKGIEIDYLGIDNENAYNEGGIMPSLFRQVVDLVKVKSTELSFKMPLFVGYEDYGPNKNNWMKTMNSSGWLDRMDIYGTHYYPNLRPFSKLSADLGYAGTMPFWSTEPHWDNKDTADDWDEAEQAICALWDQVDLGMTGFMWWGYARSGSIRGNLMREFSVPLKDGRLIDIDDKDGRSTTAYGELITHAFRENNTLTVYVVNNNATIAYTNYGFGLSSGTIVNNVNYLQWVKAGDINGIAGVATLEGNKKFRLTIPANSITKFSFIIDLGTAVPQVSDVVNFSVVPSLATTSINIKGLSTGADYKIFNANGKFQFNSTYQFANISGFEPGVYLVKSEDGQVARFVKR